MIEQGRMMWKNRSLIRSAHTTNAVSCHARRMGHYSPSQGALWPRLFRTLGFSFCASIGVSR